MRILARALKGLILTAVSASLLGWGGWRLHEAISLAEKPQRGNARERSFVVDAGRLEEKSFAPKVTAYGVVQAWTTLEIRAPAAGPITEISPNVRDGLTVAAGELLFRIDPEIAARRVTDAKAALAQAEAELAEAQQSRTHLDAELAAAEGQARVRRADLTRKQSLFAKNLVTASALDEIRLAVSAAEQAVIAKAQAQLALKGRIEKAEAGVSRARLTLSDAERAFADTSYRAPFSGRLADVTLTLGRRVGQNEKLATLIDPAALEVSFPVRNTEFGYLADAAHTGKLAPLKVRARLDLGGKTKDIVVEGRLDRPAALASVQSGRTVYARLTGANAAALRPGDFVTVEVTEPELHNVAVIPADAASVDGRILLIDSDGRLAEHAARILRRQAETLVVADVPFGSQYVRRRLPYLAAGIKVKPRDTSEPEAAPAISSTPSPERRGDESEVVVLDETRRAALIAHVKSDEEMPEPRRQRVLEELAKPQISRRIVDRIERRMNRQERRS